MTIQTTVMTSDIQWYVLYTRRNCEKKVANALLSQGIEALVPTTRVFRKLPERRYRENLLFPHFVFARLGESTINKATSISGVEYCLHWLNKPAIISAEEIEIVKRFTEEYSEITVEKSQISVNDSVKVLGRPQLERGTNVLEISHKSICIYLPTLGYNLTAWIDKSNVDPMTNIVSKMSNQRNLLQKS